MVTRCGGRVRAAFHWLLALKAQFRRIAEDWRALADPVSGVSPL
jgi:hypothetical protein